MDRDNTDYILYRTADALSRILSRRTAYAVAVKVADSCHKRDTVGRSAVVENLRRIRRYRGEPADDASLHELSRRTFHQFGKYLVDFFRYDRPSGNGFHELLTVSGTEHFAEALGTGRGVLVVTAHLGNWDLGAAHLVHQGHVVHTVALPQGDGRANRLFQSRRQARGLKVLPHGRAARDIVKALREGRIVALLTDREYGPAHHTAMLFGAPATLPVGPARLSLSLGVPILPAFVLRQPDETYRLQWHAPLHPSAGETLSDIQARICRALELAIGENPSQWYMFRPFWADGEGI